MEGRNDFPVAKRAFDAGVGQVIHDMEARILQALCGFAEATNKRFNQIDLNLAMCNDRLGTFESRLLEVEKRLNIPPTQ
jgi:hypothetical protein